MFWQMVKGALIRQRNRFALIALTVALGASLAAAMLNVMFDIGDKVNQELKAYGANITITPQSSTVLQDVYGVEGARKEYLKEEDLGKIKSIFWANNIVAFTPELDGKITLDDGAEMPAIGTWFAHEMTLPTGEPFTTGDQEIKSWWQIDGAWPKAADEVLVGTKLAQEKGIALGDTLRYREPNGSEGTLKVVGIVSGGGAEDEAVSMELSVLQSILSLQGKIDRVSVSAITTPENDLARKAAANPDRLSQKEREIWYCTAYVSSIAFQLEEAIEGASAQPVRQIAESEGKILDKTELLMLLITVLSLLSAALGVSNLVSANIMERSRELGLMKALGASNLSVILMVLAEIFVTGIIGGIAGCIVGLGLAQVIGETVFGSNIATNVLVLPIVGGLMIIVLLVGSLPAIRMLLSLQPASVLHGR
ncbi:ABC transporter permease [Selenomonas sp. TAMA-11512]|uniref:ABC transporter permease n=1 Tax=Selenomonas sp. TAMA-11512 TaxID=3095337 RepID=UPI00308FE088|nr:ABC transporter permease [Selenomonas sp. TAMA-11512]